MKIATLIAGGLLGLVFVVFGLNFFLGFIPIPPAPEGHPAAFMGAMYMTGFLGFVKVLEIIGGVLVAIPKTRNFGLLILGPISAARKTTAPLRSHSLIGLPNLLLTRPPRLSSTALMLKAKRPKRRARNYSGWGMPLFEFSKVESKPPWLLG